jgi:hypothetical protein
MIRHPLLSLGWYLIFLNQTKCSANNPDKAEELEKYQINYTIEIKVYEVVFLKKCSFFPAVGPVFW